MKQYEIRHRSETTHPSYFMADSIEDAKQKYIKHYNEIHRDKISEDDLFFIIESNKVRIETVIPQYIKCQGRYSNYDIDDIESMFESWSKYSEVILEPDFQRGRVWTDQQQIAYIEYLLSGGMSGRDIYFNQPDTWTDTNRTPYELVDGLQRLTAIRKFMNDEIIVFGKYKASSFQYFNNVKLNIHVNNLKTRREVLQWYLQMNSGGTPHTQAEIDRVKQLLEKESDNG